MKEPDDDAPLKFGKYKGLTPREVAASDPSYIVWMRANVLPSPVSKDLALECEEKLDDVDADRFDPSEFEE